MVIEALSIVSPAVTDIIKGTKVIEIRSWLPPKVPLHDLVLVENHRYLHQEGDEDTDGQIVAVVDIIGVHDWSHAEAERDGKLWQTGYYAWEIANVRPVAEPIKAIARRKVYTLSLENDIILPLTPL